MEDIDLIATGEDGAQVAVRLTVTTPPSVVRAVVFAQGFERTYKEVDLFQCLRALRIDLEDQGLLLCCQGALSNVSPSGMSRQMSDGRYAYALQAGQKATEEDLVDIFAAADCGQVVTVEDQMDSIRKIFRTRG